MVECRCPKCRNLFKVTSPEFGTEITCPTCGIRIVLDVDLLAHFDFPNEIVVKLSDTADHALPLRGVRIQAERIIPLAAVLTDAYGAARISKENYEQSRLNHDSWSIMDHPGDHSLGRYVTIWAAGPQAFGPERLDLEMSEPRPTVWLKQSFTGIYVSHWEVARFVIETGKRFFGLMQRVEKWQPIFPDGFQLPGTETVRTVQSPPEYFRMTIRGSLGPKGRFGHKGICSRQITITEVVSCEKTETPGKTW